MELRCKIDAEPSAMITWSKDDMDVDEWVINKDVTTSVSQFLNDFTMRIFVSFIPELILLTFF